METRPTNKTTHPGLPDLPTPKKPKGKKNTKKGVVPEKKLQQVSKELAQIEDESAADYANDKTPGVPPPKKHESKRAKNPKKPLLVEEGGGEDASEPQDTTDNDFNEGSDIERTVRKKQKSGTQFRNTIQDMRKMPPMELEEANEDDTSEPGQGGKVVEAGKGKNKKGGKKGVAIRKGATAAGTATQKETSDIEMQGKFLLDSIASLTKLPL